MGLNAKALHLKALFDNIITLNENITNNEFTEKGEENGL